MSERILVIEDESRIANFETRLDLRRLPVDMAYDGQSGLDNARYPARSDYSRLDAARPGWAGSLQAAARSRRCAV
jgi:hypothetical protein